MHCQAGVSRSPTIVIAYLMKHRHLTMLDAYEALKSRRPVISPNLNFMGQLLEWESLLKPPTITCSGWQSDDHQDKSGWLWTFHRKSINLFYSETLIRKTAHKVSFIFSFKAYLWPLRNKRNRWWHVWCDIQYLFCDRLDNIAAHFQSVVVNPHLTSPLALL